MTRCWTWLIVKKTAKSERQAELGGHWEASSSLAEHSAVRPRVKLPIPGDVALMLLAVYWFLAAMLKIASFLPSVIGGPGGCLGVIR